jgi:predicted acyltransferase
MSFPSADTSTVSPPAPAAGARLVSLDALRGFDMFWILGADALFTALAKVCDIAPLRLIAGQLEHKDWDGFAFYDLIFPLFVFMAGVSVVFSLNRLIATHGRAAAVKRVLGRGALLFAIGLFYSGGLSTRWPDIRVLGVLQRIALAYTGAGLLFCFFKPRSLAAIAAVTLVGYWALLTFVPIRDVQMEKSAVPARLGIAKPTPEQAKQLFDSTTARVTGHYEPGLNLTNHLDFEYLGGRRYDTYYDPEGLLSTFPAIVSCLLGVFAGLLLRRADWDDAKKIAWLATAGALAVTLGFLWGLQFPVVKKIWTSSFVLVAGGYSALLLAAFYYMIDVRKWRGWCVPFVWIGMNPITLYLISGIVGYRKLAARLAGGDLQAWLDTTLGNGWGNLGIAVVGLALMLTLARFLHRRGIFLRV